MIKYKGYSVDEVLKSGNVCVIDGMINSVSSKKSRYRGDKEIVKECENVLKKLNEYKEKNGLKKENGKRGKYDEVKSLEELSKEELDGMYESLYSRRCYYRKRGDNKRLKEVESRIEEIKKERLKRKRKELDKMIE